MFFAANHVQSRQVVAAFYCEVCEEFLCKTCINNHKTSKATKGHVPITVCKQQAKAIKECEPCKDKNTCQAAENFCKECEEYFCEDCTSRHKLSKATNAHVPVRMEEVEPALNKADTEDTSQTCKPCTALGSFQIAEHFCEPCEEFLCKSCTDNHRRVKATKSHTPISISLIKRLSNPQIKTLCDICNYFKKQSEAEKMCQECDETLCDVCAGKHLVQKLTKDHNIKPLSERQVEVEMCDSCALCNKLVASSVYCKECPEFLCEICAEKHKKQKATRNHILVSLPPRRQSISEQCDLCLYEGVLSESIYYCSLCEEFLCESCSKTHRVRKITKSHQLCRTNEAIENLEKCQLCLANGNSMIAKTYCEYCKECFCTKCSEIHKKLKATRNHSLVLVKGRRNTESDTSTVAKATTAKTKPYTKDDSDTMIPGKPKTSNVTADSLTLSWERPRNVKNGAYYQVSYKDLDSGGKWKFLPEEYITSTAEIVDLKSNTLFVFRVRVVCEHSEGPYSPESEECWTTNSPASKIAPHALLIEDSTPKILALPTTEIKDARNAKAKTRKFEIGSPSPNENREKTIMLVGEIGTGKSTMVDAIMNYVLGVNWSEPFRFSVVNLEQEEKERVKSHVMPMTEWISCYTVHPEKESRLNYRLNVIDIPGLGNARNPKRDLDIVEQIRQLFSVTEHKGFASIDAVCFLIKASDAHLNALQKYIFQLVMSMFGKDIESNICSLVTFADGPYPPVLAALKETELPFGKHFTFNNSGLFSKNIDIGTCSLSPMFWEMSMKSFRAFFTYLDSLRTCSLQLTKAVLDERFRLDAAVINLQQCLDVRLAKVDQLKQEFKVLNDNISLMKDNANFEYEAVETQQIKKELRPGLYALNCTHCHFICHDNCSYPNDSELAHCIAMDSDGNCKMCPFKCHWRKHANTPYVFEYVQVKVKKTYSEMKQKYKEATGKILCQEQMLEQMGSELNKINEDIEGLIEIVKMCDERLSEIALVPVSLTMKEHIGLMINTAKLEKNSDLRAEFMH